jgi:hypothetical protein
LVSLAVVAGTAAIGAAGECSARAWGWDRPRAQTNVADIPGIVAVTAKA